MPIVDSPGKRITASYGTLMSSGPIEGRDEVGMGKGYDRKR